MKHVCLSLCVCVCVCVCVWVNERAEKEREKKKISPKQDKIFYWVLMGFLDNVELSGTGMVIRN